MVERKLNLRLVVSVLAGLLVCAAVTYFVHDYQMGRHARALRSQAEAMEKSGDLEKTIELLQRYLTLAPGDTETLEHCGRLLEMQPGSMGDRWRVVGIYETVLEREPLKEDLRRRVVDVLMKLDAYDDARNHLEVLLNARPGDGELWQLLGQCQQGLGENEHAAASYAKAIELAPHAITCYGRLANVLRNNLDLPARADEVMDTLIQANPESAASYLNRGLYRMDIGRIDLAAEDLDKARRFTPDDARVLAVSAEIFQLQGKIEDARQSWRRGIEKHPDDLSMYVGLGTLEMESNRAAEAAVCLELGLLAFPQNAELLYLLTETYLQQNQPEKARTLISQASAGKDQALIALLTARVLQATGHVDEAIPRLEEVDRDPAASRELRGCAWLALGNGYERLGDPDRQVSALERAVALSPSLLVAHCSLGSAYLELGRVDDALGQFRQLSQLRRPPERCWLLLARTLLQRNLSLPAARRDWEEVDHALEHAEALPSQAVAATLLRADSLVARNDLKKARVVLKGARSRYPDEIAAWTASAALAARQRDVAGALRLLADARKRLGDRPELQLEELNLRNEEEGPEFEAYLQSVEKSSAAYPPDAQARVLQQVAEAYYRRGRPRDGERVCRQLLVLKSVALPTATAILDLALGGNDEKLQSASIKALKAVEGPEGTWWRFGEAAQWILRAQRGDKSAAAAAKSLLIEIKARRPTWSRAELLAALLDDLNHEPGKAVASYLRAFELGHRQTTFARGLVQRLIESGRIQEADEVVRKLQQQVLLHGDFARLGAEIAVRNRQFDRAADLARQAVPADCRDWRKEVWLGQLLAVCGHADEAESTFRQAVALADDVPDAWIALVAHLNGQNNVRNAEAEIARMKEKVAPDRLEVALGDCYQALGRFDLAEKHYQTARRQQPRDDQAMQRLASYYVRILQPAKAEPTLRDLLDPASPVPLASVAWSRRQLALILAGGNDADRHREAIALLERNRRGGILTQADQRILELLKATDKEARAAALRAVEDSVAANPLAPEEDLFVAHLYGLDQDWPRERDHLIAAIGLDPKNPEYLALLVRRLLDHNQKDEARSWLDKLATLEPGSERVRKLQAELAPLNGGA